MICGILLAAGTSTRYGRNKLLEVIGKKHLIEFPIESMNQAGLDRIIVVADRSVAVKCRDYEVDVVILPSQISMGNREMSLSLKLGMEKLPEGSDGVLIHLGDMPLVLPETIRHLVKETALTSKGIVLPSYNGKLGHPRIFKRKYFEKLKKLKGDEGGRSIIENNLEDILVCEVNDPGVVFDVDLPEDLEKMKFLLKEKKV